MILIGFRVQKVHYPMSLAISKGIFTTIHLKDGVPEFLEAHLERLSLHREWVGIKTDLPSLYQLNKAIDKKNARQGSYRLKVILTPENYRIEITPYIPPLQTPLSLVVEKIFPDALFNRIKPVDYHQRIALKESALNKGFDDVLTIDPQGIILEASMANIFWIQGKTLYTPDPALPILSGIYLSQLIKNGPFKCIEGEFTVSDICGDVYLCNALMHALPVKSVIFEHSQMNYKQHCDIVV